MNKKLFFIFFISTLLISYIIVYASGGGGGGGCGKNNPNCNGGGGGGGGETPWVYAELYGYAGVNPYFSNLINRCNLNPNGYGLVPNGGNNTFPVLIPQYLGQNNNYLAQIIIENLSTGEIKYFELLLGFHNHPVQVPRVNPFRVKVTYISECSQCMSPEYIQLVSGEGRRLDFVGNEEYTSGGQRISFPVPLMVLASLSSCQ